MTAETLRRAADLMREQVAWVTADGAVDEWYEADEVAAIIRRSEPEHSRIDHDAAHIAAWSPDVALAVAKLLEDQAQFIEEYGSFFDLADMGDANALAVARLYLGEAS